MNGFELTQEIMRVLALPPKESFRIRVNLLSRYGIWAVGLFIVFLELSAKILMQFPKANKLLLIFAPYCIFFVEFED